MQVPREPYLSQSTFNFSVGQPAGDHGCFIPFTISDDFCNILKANRENNIFGRFYLTSNVPASMTDFTVDGSWWEDSAGYITWYGCSGNEVQAGFDYYYSIKINLTTKEAKFFIHTVNSQLLEDNITATLDTYRFNSDIYELSE